MSYEVTEYGLFNIVPDTGIPEGWEWLYEHPFQSEFDRKTMDRRCKEINNDRRRTFEAGRAYYQVTTYCEVRARTVTYSDWQDISMAVKG